MNFDRDLPPMTRGDHWLDEAREREARRAEFRITVIQWIGVAFALAALAVAMLWGQG